MTTKRWLPLPITVGDSPGTLAEFDNVVISTP